ncbi:hypothetical protein ACOJUR_03540 [Alicyclobacillus tolerans]|uniref:hypothetical protein n=1 Tax=Alicyclobacillus tolerans TaxID=90970 RepID=UPI003B7A2423
MKENIDFQTVHQLSNMIFSALHEQRFVDVFVLLQHRADLIDRVLQISTNNIENIDIEKAYLDTQNMIEKIKISLDKVQAHYESYLSNVNAHRAYMMSKIAL